MVLLAILSPFLLIALIVVAAWLVLRRRNPSTILARVAASAIGVYAGVLGVEHGFFETLQGSHRPGGIMIYAIGVPPCQPAAVWHGCEPAMTLIPNFLLTGILAILAALVVLAWAAWRVQRKNGGLILILLSIVMLLVGGGFFPPLFGIIAGVIGTRLKPVTIP
ncbi:MAG: hypothetical protein WCE68_14645 [Anaerolineales bacterium]